MIKIKHKAFTLSEVLITLAVVGTLAALVVPGLIKDYNSKANMAMLQNMVANLQSAVQTELTKEGATDLDATNIKKDCKASAKLKNGVALCMSTFEPTMSAVSGGSRKVATVYMDLNGAKEPNVAGADFYAVYIYPVTTLTGTIPTHPGDIAGVPIETPAGQSCNTNSSFSPLGCYSQAEQSGFDPNYWKKL